MKDRHLFVGSGKQKEGGAKQNGSGEEILETVR